MKATKILEQMMLEEFNRKYPGQPYPYIKKYKTSTANGLTQFIIKFLSLKGHQAERINTQGRRIDQTKTFTDVLGYKRQIGSVKYVKGTGTRGSADISSTILGKSVKWEVKIKDRQSPDQKKYEQDIIKAGGYYFIVHNPDEFMEKYNELVNEIE